MCVFLFMHVFDCLCRVLSFTVPVGLHECECVCMCWGGGLIYIFSRLVNMILGDDHLYVLPGDGWVFCD